MVPDVSSSTMTMPPLSPTSSDAEGVKSGRGLGQPRQRGDGADLGAQVGGVDARQPRRDFLPIGQPLIAAEPANLGDQLLHVGDPLRGNGFTSTPDGCGHRRRPPTPAGQRLHSVSVTNGMTGCSNRSTVSSTTASTAVVCLGPSGDLDLGQLEVPVAELVPGEVVERLRRPG